MLTIPTFRQDLNCMADLAEEIARIHGYDNIPSTVPTTNGGIGGISYEETINRITRAIVEENGFSQGMTYSFESAKAFDKLLIPEDSPMRRTIEIINPLGEDFKVMRTQLLNGLLTSLGTNSSRRNKNVRLYELGTVYLPHETWPAKPTEEGKTSDLPLDEVRRLAMGMYGEGDFFVMKGVIEELVAKLHAGRLEFAPGDHPAFAKGAAMEVKLNGRKVGVIGAISAKMRHPFRMTTQMALCELELAPLVRHVGEVGRLKPVPQFPSVRRDIALSAHGVSNDDVVRTIRKNGGSELVSVELFDVFKDSKAYSLEFRSADRTLTDDEVGLAFRRIVEALRAVSGVEVREG
jgi:phenylalanyl-tRNA synthetase beta chain